MSCSRLLKCISCWHAVRQKYQDGRRKIRWIRFSLYFAIRVVSDKIGSLFSHVHGGYLLTNKFVNDIFTHFHSRYYTFSLNLMFVVYIFSEHVHFTYFLFHSWKISTLMFTWIIIFHFLWWYNLSCSMKIYFLLPFRQVSGFLRVLRFPPPVNLTAPRYNWNLYLYWIRCSSRKTIFIQQ